MDVFNSNSHEHRHTLFATLPFTSDMEDECSYIQKRVKNHYLLTPRQYHTLKQTYMKTVKKNFPKESFKHILKSDYFEYLTGYVKHFKNMLNRAKDIESKTHISFFNKSASVQKFYVHQIDGTKTILKGNPCNASSQFKENIKKLENNYNYAFPLTNYGFACLKREKSESVSTYDTYLDYLQEYGDYLKRKISETTSFNTSGKIIGKRGTLFRPTGETLEKLNAFYTNHFPYLPYVEESTNSGKF